jgi:hypothetical protein
MKERQLDDKSEHIEALNQAVAELDQHLHDSIERDQHEMIDHLDEHFDAVETRLQSLRAFCEALRKELKSRKSES